jgi:metal-responsive CopG/Arc/MetJ family transcriptional regulator
MKMSQTKITVKIYEPLLRDFDRQLAKLFIKRDAFLNAMIQEEVQHLAKDLEGKQLTVSAKRYIAGELKRMGTRQVNVVVDKTTADALDSVVKASNLVRDAFINRLIMLLRSTGPLLKYLELPEFIKGSDYSGVETMPTSPLKAIESVHGDPLFYLRVACEARYETGLYLLDLPPKFAGFACYMDESMVPTTIAYEQMQRDTQAMLDELSIFETEAFQNSTNTQGVKS